MGKRSDLGRILDGGVCGMEGEEVPIQRSLLVVLPENSRELLGGKQPKRH